MPSLNMSDPFPFDSTGIDDNVLPNTIGNYALGWTDSKSGLFRIKYVGRSMDVRKRLHEHLNNPNEDWSDVTQFKFSKAKNEAEAYTKECQNWHDFGESKGLPLNENHPAKPKGRSDLKCPVPNCPQ